MTHYQLMLDKTRIHIFQESKKRRIYVGEICYKATEDCYLFIYDDHYRYSKNAIPLGPEFNLFQSIYCSEKGKMFPIFLDRIPDRNNPAYADYCRSQNVAIDETNPIVLLGTIGKRGPSSFIFEPIYQTNFKPSDITKFRDRLDITQYDFAHAFHISQATLQRIEAGKSKDDSALKKIEIFLTFPDVALWQLQQTGGTIHHQTLMRLRRYFLESM